ncbi:MAG: D-alanine--D-alanine ligase, partial [Steroidobacter sp.]
MIHVTDAKQFGRVAVLMGGTSSEREVSLISGKAVLQGLLNRGVDAFAVDGIEGLIPLLVGKQIDRVFNILHGQHGGGEDGVLQGLLEAFGIPYTGSKVLGSALTMDKIRTKQVWLANGLPTPRYVQLSRNNSDGDTVIAAVHQLGLPVIVKPACEGSSVGVTRVFKDSDLPAAIELASRYPGDLLMEQLIVGSEYSVPVLGDQVLPSIRIVP